MACCCSIPGEEMGKGLRASWHIVAVCVVQLLSSESTYTVLQKNYILSLLKNWNTDSNSTYRWLSLHGMGNVALHLQNVSGSYFFFPQGKDGRAAKFPPQLGNHPLSCGDSLPAGKGPPGESMSPLHAMPPDRGCCYAVSTQQ